MNAVATYIKKLFEEKTAKGDLGTKTDLAESLELLSVGIYTEEERFVFELLQNAVDAFDKEGEELKIKIIVQDKMVIFMHNGAEFSTRDIEGICSVGNGDKTNDIKKIGYKGIGFKSVFRHSQYVTIQTGDTIFSFNENYWSDFLKNESSSDTGREYKMPWQIIPISETQKPVNIDTTGYNVITYLRIDDTSAIATKAEKLLSNPQFLLFLRHNNIVIDFEAIDKRHSISKRSKLNRNLDSSTIEQSVSLCSDGKEESRWLIYKNENVAVPNNVAKEIADNKHMPRKLRGVKSYDLSFAIELDERDHFKRVEKSMLFTYLPTSCHVNLPFLVNANFITDAGRQHLDENSPWNNMVIAQIPTEFIKWIATLSKEYGDYYKVLPTQNFGVDAYESVYKENLDEAVEKIAFVPNLLKEELLLVGDTIYDEIEMSEAIETERYDKFLANEFGKNISKRNFIDPNAGKALKKFGSKAIDRSAFGKLLENAPDHLAGLTVDECAKLCKFIYSKKDEEGLIPPPEELSYYPFLLDEESNLTAPRELLFPTEYGRSSEFAKQGKYINADLMEKLADLKEWLISLNIKEVSAETIFEKIINKKDFFDNITVENAIKAIQFIFDNDIKIQNSTYSYKFVSQKGDLKSSFKLFLNAQDFGIGINKDFDEEMDIFISKDYIREGDDKLKWAMFFKELGVRDSFEIGKECFSEKENSDFWEYFSDKIEEAKKEYWEGQNGRLWYFFPEEIRVTSVPLLRVKDTKFDIAKMVWNSIFPKQIGVLFEDEFAGCTGFISRKMSMRGGWDGHHFYLSEPFIKYALKTFDWLPASDGKLHKVTEILENTEENTAICGKYFPTLNVDCQIHGSWDEFLPFYKKLTLDNYLSILEKIEEDRDNTSKNLERISLIYNKLARSFNFEKDSEDYKTVAQWAKLHKILSEEQIFENPANLVILSNELGAIKEIENQVYRGTEVNNDERFMQLMLAMGVKQINEFKPVYEGRYIDENFKQRLLFLSGFLTSLSLGKGVNEKDYNKKQQEIKDIIESLTFIQNDKIFLTYGEESLERKIYVEDNVFHYVGKLGITTLELMHEALATRLEIKNNLTVMLTIMQMRDFDEIAEYLEVKGFETKYVEHNNLPASGVTDISNVSEALLGVSESNDLAIAEQSEYLEEAKEVVLKMLKEDGFDTENCTSECSCVSNLKKNGVEFPLVVKSRMGGGDNKYQFSLDVSEWGHLMQENSMLLVNCGNGGVRKVDFADLLRNQDKMTISFELESFRNPENITKLAKFVQYFKGLRFDFSNLLTSPYEPMRNYQIGHKNPNAFNIKELPSGDKNMLI